MSPVRTIVFLGSKRLGLEVLQTIWRLRPAALQAVVTYDDRKDRRCVLDGFLSFGDQTGVPVYVAEDPRHAEQIVASVSPDLCLVVCWYWLLSDSFIRKLACGAIGIHNSLLPKYRGGSPLVWAIINGETETGFSVFSFSDSMDAGDIWWQEKVSISSQDTVESVTRKLEAALLRSLETRWRDLLDGKLSAQEQKHELATYCAQRFPADSQIDWRWPADKIVNFVRALKPPYPCAFFRFQDSDFMVEEIELFPFPYFGAPGQVARTGESGVYVVCGDNRAVILKALVVENAPRPANLVLTSIRIRLE